MKTFSFSVEQKEVYTKTMTILAETEDQARDMVQLKLDDEPLALHISTYSHTTTEIELIDS